jgi:hypothetical protein
MLDLLLKIIEQLNEGSILALMFILLMVFWIMIKIGKIINHYDNFVKKQDKLDNSINALENKLDNSINAIQKDIHLIKIDYSKIKIKLDIVYDYYLNTVKAHSPISLTKIGKKIALDIKLENLVIKHWGKISEKIKANKNPTNPYDIQAVSMDIADKIFKNIFSEEEKMIIKNYAFHNSKNLLEIYPIIGVISRDKYLKEIDISLKKIDKHSPKHEA